MGKTLNDIETIEITRRDIVDAFARVTGAVVGEFADRVDCDDEEGNEAINRLCIMFGKAGADLVVELFDKEEF